jgi:hypothetical protein
LISNTVLTELGFWFFKKFVKFCSLSHYTS